MDTRSLTNWWIPAAVLAAAVGLLVGLNALVEREAPAPWGPEAPESAVIGAVERAPADPFRYSGRPLGTVLSRFGPARTGWEDAGWAVEPRPGGGFRVSRRFTGPGGTERHYRFTVSADLQEVRPANGHARALMLIGPAPAGG
jgi:hypothetical protein